MDKLSQIKRFKNIESNAPLFTTKEFDRVDKELDTLKETDSKIAESITILNNNKADKSSIEELSNDFTEKIAQVEHQT
jgi:hypothetical protein